MKITLFTLTFFLLFAQLRSQVRIGGITPPKKGAILDINSDSNVSFGGLLLPRVTLKSLDSLDDIDSESVVRPNPQAHIGLLIYALAEDKTCPIFPEGIYVWTGSKWGGLINNSATDLQRVIDAKVSNLIYDKDQDGNTIVARTFGSAGVWMIHNLAVTSYADATPISRYVGSVTSDSAYTYPNSTNWSDKPKNYIPQQGLLYNWKAATKGSTTTLDQKQATALDDAPGANEVEQIESMLQGICPNGWHLPSDREWTLLAKELYLHAAEYSNYTTDQIPSVSWNSIWDTSIDTEIGTSNANDVDSFGAGNIAKDMCKIVRTNSDLPNQFGYSKALIDGGFNVLFTGYVSSDHMLDYGLKAFFWTSSANSNTAYIRTFSSNMSGMMKSLLSKEDLLSVRCKKN